MFERFKEIREERNISKEQLSHDIDVHIDFINSIENGFNAPIHVLRKYAVYFGVTADYLLELTDEENGYSDGGNIMTNIKIKGLKKAVGDYQRFNAEGTYSPRYGYLMFNKEDGTIWTDEFYSLGHNSWKEYNSKSIINLGKMMTEQEIEINMKNVKEFIEKYL